MLDKLEDPGSGFWSWFAPCRKRSQSVKLLKLHMFWKGRDCVVCDEALETAHYITVWNRIGLVSCGAFFHEWRQMALTPILTNCIGSSWILSKHQGYLIPLSLWNWSQSASSFLRALEKYKNYETIIIVTHGMLMRQFVPNEKWFLSSDWVWDRDLERVYHPYCQIVPTIHYWAFVKLWVLVFFEEGRGSRGE